MRAEYLALVAGTCCVAGLLCLVAAIVGRPVDPQAPVRPPRRPARWRAALRDRRQRRLLGVALAAGVLVLAVTRWPVAGLAAAFAVWVAPRLLSGQVAKARIARLEALEQWTRSLADELGVSAGLEQTLSQCVSSAPVAIAPQLRALGRRLEARMPTERALQLLADELDGRVGDTIAASLMLAAKRRGPGLKGRLTSMAEMVARDVAAMQQIEADRAQHRTVIRWLLILLPGVVLGFTLLQRSYFAAYDTVLGQLALAAVMAIFAAAFWWMRRLGGDDPERRFLVVAAPSPAVAEVSR